MKRTPLKQGKGFKNKNNLIKKTVFNNSIKKIKNSSIKGKIKEKDKNEIYKIIDSKRPHKCEGCGLWNRPLSHSHLISVGYNKIFAASERNIRIHCISFDGIKGCHEKWEDGLLQEVEQMIDFKENMIIVKELDINYFKKKIIKIYGDSFAEHL